MVFKYLTNSDGNEKILMTHDQFMKLHEERSHRNIDPFELIVFQEEQSAALKDWETELKQQNKERFDLETLSIA
jgi:hypothetical protein